MAVDPQRRLIPDLRVRVIKVDHRHVAARVGTVRAPLPIDRRHQDRRGQAMEIGTIVPLVPAQHPLVLGRPDRVGGRRKADQPGPDRRIDRQLRLEDGRLGLLARALRRPSRDGLDPIGGPTLVPIPGIGRGAIGPQNGVRKIGTRRSLAISANPNTEVVCLAMRPICRRCNAGRSSVGRLW